MEGDESDIGHLAGNNSIDAIYDFGALFDFSALTSFSDFEYVQDIAPRESEWRQSLSTPGVQSASNCSDPMALLENDTGHCNQLFNSSSALNESGPQLSTNHNPATLLGGSEYSVYPEEISNEVGILDVGILDDTASQEYATSIGLNYGDFPRWIEGVHWPSNPCSHCRLQRLECLILRTSPANPNPVTSCASCVALFRECSMSQGEKRGASEFETPAPILGHLHGVTEELHELDTFDIHYTGQSSTTMPSEAGQDSRISSGQRHTTMNPQPFSRKCVKLLKTWLTDHHDYPFPTSREKNEIALKTGLTKVQISNWFANARRRGRQTKNPPFIQQSNDSYVSDTDGRLLAMNPMERWQNSPPEEEPVPSSVVAQAIMAATSFLSSNESEVSSSADCSLGLSKPMRYPTHHASSIASESTSQSGISSSSAGSAWSRRSCTSATSRRGWRRTNTRSLNEISFGTDSRPYKCTLCPASFKKSHDWQRHERSIHLPLERWICTPNGGIVWSIPQNQPQCVFCGDLAPSASHLENHDLEACSDRPLRERTFFRKDYLRQHLSKFHGCLKPLEKVIDDWKVEQPEIRSRCGFCCVELETWVERTKHLRDHFREGKDMDQWVGDWGFDEDIQLLLQNAVLPENQ